jgi:hypothetical protein
MLVDASTVMCRMLVDVKENTVLSRHGGALFTFDHKGTIPVGMRLFRTRDAWIYLFSYYVGTMGSPHGKDR